MLSVAFTPTDTANYNIASKSVTINVLKAAPIIMWSNPADITFGTALGSTQLNATARVAGTFNYTPAAGTVLNAGAGQSLAVQFTPADAVNYSTATKTITLNVLRAAPVITWNNPSDIIYGMPLGATQLNASANVAGSFSYSPASGIVLNAGNGQSLAVTFTPSDTANYTNVSKIVSLNVLKATPVITWNNPVDITYGTALSSLQLNATANVAGSFNYALGLGTMLNAGNAQPMSVTFMPTNTVNYNVAMKAVSLNVLQALLTVTVNNAFRNQGEANPAFSGTLTGLKNNDAITASYSTTANSGSVPGTYTITATLNDLSNRLGNYSVTNTPGILTVLNSCGITLNPATLPTATRDTPFVQVLSASPTGSYTFSLLEGTLPPGLQLVNVLGIYSLRGTPTTAGTYTFKFKAKKNNSTCESVRSYTAVVP